MFHIVYYIDIIPHKLLCSLFYIIARHNYCKFFPKVICKFSALTHQFQCYRQNFSVYSFCEYPYIIIVIKINVLIYLCSFHYLAPPDCINLFSYSFVKRSLAFSMAVFPSINSLCFSFTGTNERCTFVGEPLIPI